MRGTGIPVANRILEITATKRNRSCGPGESRIFWKTAISPLSQFACWTFLLGLLSGDVKTSSSFKVPRAARSQFKILLAWLMLAAAGGERRAEHMSSAYFGRVRRCPSSIKTPWTAWQKCLATCRISTAASKSQAPRPRDLSHQRLPCNAAVVRLRLATKSQWGAAGRRRGCRELPCFPFAI